MVADPNYNNQLEYGVNTISATDIEKVRVIALSDTPTCGYAWSLYYLLTNIHLPIVVPTAQRIAPRSSTEIAPKNLYPNPTLDGVYLQNLDLGSIIKISIRDVTGVTQVIPTTHRQSRFIDLSYLQAGVFIVTIELQNEVLVSEKIVKI